MKRCLLAVSLFILFLPSVATSQSTKPESLGAVLSFVVGSGSGRFLIADPKAPIFLAGETIPLGIYVFSAINGFRSYYGGTQEAWIFWNCLGVFSFSAFAAFRFWEIGDMFGIAIERRKADRQLNFEPTWELNPDHISVGIKMRL